MALLGFLLYLVFITMIQGVNVQSGTEAKVNTDSNLRRTLQIITQDLRNSTYGMVSSIPYPSSNSAISIAIGSDNAIHPISGPASSFQSSQYVQAILPATSNWPASTLFTVVNPSREQATILKVSSPVNIGGVATIQHSGQQNTVCYSAGNFIQRVEIVGYSYDIAKKTIFRQIQNESGSNTFPLAFNVSDFVISYISNLGNSYNSRNAIPTGEQIAKISIQITMTGRSNGKTITSSLSGSVETPKLFTLSTNPINYIAPNDSLTCS